MNLDTSRENILSLKIVMHLSWKALESHFSNAMRPCNVSWIQRGCALVSEQDRHEPGVFIFPAQIWLIF